MSKDEVEVTAKGEGRFAVKVAAQGSSTSHQVTVPGAYLEELGLAGADEEQVVRASFAFLLEREPPTSIMPSFDLPVIERYFPEYRSELPRRMG
jgi:hypothetical protein